MTEAWIAVRELTRWDSGRSDVVSEVDAAGVDPAIVAAYLRLAHAIWAEIPHGLGQRPPSA